MSCQTAGKCLVEATRRAFEDTPLVGVRKNKMMGPYGEAIVEHFAKDLFFGKPITRPTDTGLGLKGNERNAQNTTVDFLLGDESLEIKTGTLYWNTSHACWTVKFRGTNRDLHDHLILVFHSPDGLHILEHVGDFGLSNGTVQVSSPSGTLAGEPVKPNKKMTNPASIAAHKKRSYELGDPAVATQNILKKFWLGGCPYITHIAFPPPR